MTVTVTLTRQDLEVLFEQEQEDNAPEIENVEETEETETNVCLLIRIYRDRHCTCKLYQCFRKISNFNFQNLKFCLCYFFFLLKYCYKEIKSKMKNINFVNLSNRGVQNRFTVMFLQFSFLHTEG